MLLFIINDNPLLEKFFDLIARQLTRRDLQEPLNDLIISCRQHRVIHSQEHSRDVRRDALVTVNEGVRLRQMMGVGRGEDSKVCVLVMRAVFGGSQRRF